MNKLTKGAVAAVAAAALLVGTGGTLAYWNASADLGGSTVTAGQLALKPGATAWTLNDKPVTDISRVRIVPGDALKFRGNFTIEAVGDNLQAEVKVTDGAASGGLLEHVKVTPAYTLKGAPITPDTKITSADNGAALGVTIDVDFPFGTSADNSSQRQALDLKQITVTLTQVAGR